MLLGPFRILDVLGEGAMGTVYRAEPLAGAPPGLPAVVALKVLHLDPPAPTAAAGTVDERRRRFEREARVGRSVRDPRVMRVLHAFEAERDGRPRWVLVLEHVPGTSLAELLAAEGRLPEALAVHVAQEVCRGLSALHAAGVVHRDLKPANILLTPDERVVIVDLGLARLSDGADALTRSGEFVGTVRYAAPEQFDAGATVGPAADLFALGVILYEALAGLPPFPAPDVGALLRRVLLGEPTPLGAHVPGVAPWVEALVDHLLARTPDARPRSALEVLEALSNGRASRWWESTGRERLRRPVHRRLHVDRRTPFTGRQAERERLAAQLREAAGGRGRLVLLRGPEGAGTSRLLDQVLQDAPEVLPGVGVACGGTVGGGATLAAAVHELLGDLAGPRAGSASATAPDLPPATALAARARAASRERPWLLALDGLEAALPASLDLLVALAHALRDRPVLLLATLADGEDADRSLAAVPGSVPLEVLEVGPLPAADLEALLAARLASGALARDLLAPLEGALDGLPGEALLLVDGLEREGALATSADGTRTRRDRPLAASALRLPRAAAEQLRRRLAALAPDDRELCDAAAVLGPTFEPGLVAGMLGLQPLRVVRDLARLAQGTGLLRGAGRRFAFASAGVAQGVRRLVPEPLARALHAAALRALTADRSLAGGEDGDLLRARHALGAGDRAVLEAHLPAALDRLEEAGALVAAADLLRRALDEPGLLGDEARLDALLRLSDAARYRGGFVDLDARLAQALALTEGRPAARALVQQRQAVRAMERGDLAGAAARLDEAERAAAAAPDATARPRGAGRLRARLARAAGRIDDAVRLLEDDLARLRAEGAPDLEQARTLYALGLARRGGSDPGSARGPLEEALRLARAADDTPLVVDALNSLAFFPFLAGRTDEARALQEQALALAVQSGRRTLEALVRGNLGRTRLQAGDLEGALDEALRAEELMRTHGDAPGLQGVLRLLVQVQAQRGELVAGRAALRDLLALAGPGAPVEERSFAHLMEGNLASASGDVAAACAAYDAARDLLDVRTHANACLWVHLRRARAREAAGRGPDAAADVAEAERLAVQAGALATAHLARAHAAALAGRLAAGLLEEREAVGARLAPLEAACADHDLARAGAGEAFHARARAALERVAATLPSDTRRAFLQDVVLHRAIRAGAS